MPCCSCNGHNAVCKRCVCARAKKPCSTCLPMKENKCGNTLPLRVDSMMDLSRSNRVLPVMSDGLMDHAVNSLTDDHVSLAAVPRSQGLPATTNNGMISTRSSLTDDHVSLAGPNLPAVQEISCSPLDEMMTAAYGDKLLNCDGGPRDSVWCQRWSVIVQHMGQHYSLPGGSIGKRYIA